MRSERLTLPHPEITNRRFVLEPLLELDPALELPGGARAGDALEALAGQRVAKLGKL
jgi:2-amino-4-hydroxy-6-hydroxymethyldihydropteridine diphosphokinase